MLKKILIITFSSTLILFILTTIKLEGNTQNKKEPYKEKRNIVEKYKKEIITKQKTNIINKININNEKPIGKIIINKIKINNNLYDINSKKNNIEENVTILKDSILPPSKNSIIFIAAHSGNGKKAYFKNLNKLKEKDNIIITYKNKNYNYIVNEIWESKKNGYINIQKEETNQLILTTCSPNHKEKQLIINCIEKEST